MLYIMVSSPIYNSAYSIYLKRQNFEFQIWADCRRRIDADRRLSRKETSFRRSFLENLPEDGRSKVYTDLS
jgi:hypothetical protein